MHKPIGPCISPKTVHTCVAMKYPRAFVSLNTGMKEVPEPTS